MTMTPPERLGRGAGTDPSRRFEQLRTQTRDPQTPTPTRRTWQVRTVVDAVSGLLVVAGSGIGVGTAFAFAGAAVGLGALAGAMILLGVLLAVG